MKAWPVKVVGTVAVTALMLRPFFIEGGEGVIDSVRSFGVIPALLITATFFGAVALYCRSLQRIVELVEPSRRAMNPRAVWLMYVPFFNIVEDFFIIDGVTRSLAAEPRLAGTRRLGRFSGFGWCAAQAVSLSPSVVGELASLVAVALWLVHWWTIHQLTQKLVTPAPSRFSSV